jgi:hypothetical protein
MRGFQTPLQSGNLARSAHSWGLGAVMRFFLVASWACAVAAQSVNAANKVADKPYFTWFDLP